MDCIKCAWQIREEGTYEAGLVNSVASSAMREISSF